MATEAWPIKTVEVGELRLDLRNVRIREISPDETAALNYLYAAEDVGSLALEILRDGYIDNEFPIVVNEDGFWVVLEGNRRVSALKGLNNPACVPAREAQLRRILAKFNDGDVPRSIRVIVAPDRAVAQPLLARLHTRNPKRSWPRDQQAIFYHSQLGPSTTPDDLRILFPSAAGQISRFLRMAEMNALIRSIGYPDRRLHDFVHGDKLKMTAFEYAYGKPLIQAAAGLEFNPDGLLTHKKVSTAHARVLRHILAQFQAETLNTRSPELKTSAPEHEEFVARLREIRDAPTSSSGSTPDAISGTFQPGEDKVETSTRSEGSQRENQGDDKPESSPEPPAENPLSTRGPDRGHTKAQVNMQGITYSGSSPGLRRRLEELRKLNVKDFPNAAMDLLRTVLECSIKQHFRDCGDPMPPGTMLNACLTKVHNKFASDKYLVGIINALNSGGKLTSERYFLSTQALNSTNHEPDTFVEGEHVHHAWDHMAPLIRFMLADQPAPTQRN